MSDLSMFERPQLENLLGMGSGYVLDFSDRTLGDFVGESVNIDIFDAKYKQATGSKANRMRAFWKLEPNHVVGRLLSDLLKYMRQNPLIDLNESLMTERAEIAGRLLKSASPQDAQPLIFMSYARPDLPAVEAVVDLLANAGLRIWFDKKDLADQVKEHSWDRTFEHPNGEFLNALLGEVGQTGGTIHQVRDFILR